MGALNGCLGRAILFGPLENQQDATHTSTILALQSPILPAGAVTVASAFASTLAAGQRARCLAVYAFIYALATGQQFQAMEMQGVLCGREVRSGPASSSAETSGHSSPILSRVDIIGHLQCRVQ